MRNPFRSEAEAFGFVLVCVALFAAVALAGILAGGWVALAVFLVLAAAVALYVKGEPKPPDEPVLSRQGGDRRRILVVANETVAGRALRGEVVRRAGAEADVLVVCPALNSPLRHWASDEDGARAEAEQRLAESLSCLAAEGVEARGEVGDADPVQAMDDALRTFGADEIVISTHPPGRSNWLEKEVIERARERYPVPITHVVVDLERERPGLADPLTRRLGGAGRRAAALVAARVAAGDVLAGDAGHVRGHVHRVLARDEVGGHQAGGEVDLPEDDGVESCSRRSPARSCSRAPGRGWGRSSPPCPRRAACGRSRSWACPRSPRRRASCRSCGSRRPGPSRRRPHSPPQAALRRREG